MSTKAKAPAVFFAPFVSSVMRVETQWLDYNGHLNMAYYNVLMDRAVDEAFVLVGLGPDYVTERGASYFTAECHMRYLRELKTDDPVRATLQLLDYDDKRIHYYMELCHADGGWVSASAEQLALHVDMKTRKVAPFPADILANLALMKGTHGTLAKPDTLGRAMGVRREPMREAIAAGTRH